MIYNGNIFESILLCLIKYIHKLCVNNELTLVQNDVAPMTNQLSHFFLDPSYNNCVAHHIECFGHT